MKVRLYLLQLASVRLYSSSGTRLLLGTCTKKCDNTVQVTTQFSGLILWQCLLPNLTNIHLPRKYI